ncbi:uncharacterized protein B0P05DRAFT_620218 [Gilbertella persicaria]|uniref:uncharacterized protein n=1 Tax=Gilbertella persicaria TaxID=101096 RepID=UPI00221F74E3|nr:uncharacterized protein B0P05DRAFT_620218 [Gilbertella persicaria]KAI8069028.1 hypothetical protein B0P05DRAFT_620218 [Gilbertella persicaria]
MFSKTMNNIICFEFSLFAETSSELHVKISSEPNWKKFDKRIAISPHLGSPVKRVELCVFIKELRSTYSAYEYLTESAIRQKRYSTLMTDMFKCLPDLTFIGTATSPEVWSALIQARRNGQLKHVERILGPFKKNELNYHRDAVMAFSDTIVSVDITDDGAKGSGYNKIRDLFDEDQYEPRRRYAYMSGSEEEYVRRRNGDYVSEDSDSDTNTYSNGEYYAFLKDLEHLKALKEAVLERSSKITLKDVTNVVDVCPHIKMLDAKMNYS